ncbi:interleukin-11 receptor subunit alpha [Bufo gargarizans]|uniref:interleukin-11 receptor subunit alpha n=1 Tax=Bufo gargarizans TaxID=30331 RepID=UPI001CF478CC|nr:interleukin-11 receptor subunit alpha [Bufo gargarizans]XP_044131134.1 interleukin-11 receptor subunit alpha [Bufo gargarizans]
MSSLAQCLSRVMCLLAVTAVSVSLSSHSWKEEGVVYGKVGDTVTLRCSSRHASSQVEWRFNGSPNITWGFVSTLGDLELPPLGPSVMGNYSCYDRSGEMLTSVMLKVGYPPGIPSVSCRAADYHNFSCSWTSSVETSLPTRFLASYRVDRGNPEICLQDAQRPNMCSVWSSKLWTSYQMNITEENPLGSSFRILEFTVQSIVKPDPPEILSAEPIPHAPRRLRVTWEYPSTWPQEPHFQLKFRLQYRPVLHMLWSTVETANLSDIITDAFMGMEHIVQVSARDFLDAGNWSEWSVEARATPWTNTEEPEVASNVTNETTTEEPEPQVQEPIDPVEKVAVVVSLGIFAFVVLVVFLAIGALIWVRVGRTVKDGGIKTNFLTAIHLKTLPKNQIL